MQRGYLMGLRRARAKAERERDELADQFENVIDEMNAEMTGVRDELVKLRTLALIADPLRRSRTRTRSWWPIRRDGTSYPLLLEPVSTLRMQDLIKPRWLN